MGYGLDTKSLGSLLYNGSAFEEECQSLDKQDIESLQEDLRTVAHNLWTRDFFGAHAFNQKRWRTYITHPLLIPAHLIWNVFNVTDKVDKAYFDANYTIHKPLVNKLRHWVETRYKNAFCITNRRTSNANTRFDDISGKNGTASRHMRQATRDFGNGMFTTATCFYKLVNSKGDGYYILYFTFDGKSIEDCKVLCFKGGDLDTYNNYYVEEIREWNTVKPEEYS